MIFLIPLFLTSAFAQFDHTMSPCQKAVTQAKKDCGKFLGQDIQAAERLDAVTDQQKRCDEFQRLKPGKDADFDRVCRAAADHATQSCNDANTGGATGNNGAAQIVMDLQDLNATLETMREMHKNRWTRSECPETPMS